MFNPIKASDSIKNEFISYISTRFHIADRDYAKQFVDALNRANTVAKGPFLDITDSFEKGESIENLINTGDISPLFRELEGGVNEEKKEIKLKRKLYLHQQKAIQKINNNRNLVVTTGTGSGKTECFIIPIINHLLREKEAGMLDDGVRAILIYPMNALANDQMKRLRLILKDYKDITFGVYNSSTQYDDEAGIREYGNIFKDENGQALKPLPNESISRKSMQTKPPHILITNYAMLEYMMLRPNDDLVFSGAKLKFLVLDEAHIYRGATGIETSLLIRRLKARISNAGKVRHILTSATLGDKEVNKDIIKFAETLCDAKFYEDDIIRSTTIMPEIPDEIKDYPLQLFKDLSEPKEDLYTILDKYQVDYDSSKSEEEILYDLCLSARIYKVLRKVVVRPMTVSEITRLVSRELPVIEEDIVNFINIASRAEKNKTALIKARYHMFIRALEGAYISIGLSKSMYLKRSKRTLDENERLFEAVICDDCGRIGIVGKGENREFEFANSYWDDKMDIYLLKENNDLWDEDEEADEDENYVGKNDYIICSRCGLILHESNKDNLGCECGEQYRVKIRKAEIKGDSNKHKCPCCNSGTMKMFYLGDDAATAVLATELFEQLPEKEIKVKRNPKVDSSYNNLFFTREVSQSTVEKKSRKRQFLTFSDSRSEAAFFACYMTSYYKEFLRRRGIWHVIEDNKESINNNPWEITNLVDKLTAYFDDRRNRTFAEPGDKDSENLTTTSRTQAWVAVLNEMVKARRSTSLVSMGILDFVYKGNNPLIMEKIAQKYGKKVEDVTALFNLLVMDIVNSGALEIPNESESITDDDREYIYFTVAPRRFVEQKDSEKERKNSSLTGWLPTTRKNGTLYNNKRVTRIMQTLGINENEAVKLLSDYWKYLCNNGLTGKDKKYYITADKFIIRAGTEDLPIYICEKCGKTTMINCQNRCVYIRCGGKLKRITHKELLSDNHFANMYSTNNVNYPPPEGGWACNYPVVVTELTSDLFLNEKVLIGDVASQGD